MSLFYINVNWWNFPGVWVTQVPSGLQDSSQYFSPSQQCCGLNGVSSSFNFHPNLLGILPSTPTKIGITNTHMFNSLFSSPARSKYVPIFSLLKKNFLSGLMEGQNELNFQSGLLVEIRGSICSLNLQNFFLLLSVIHSGLCIYNLVIWSNLNFCTPPNGSPIPLILV